MDVSKEAIRTQLYLVSRIAKKKNSVCFFKFLFSRHGVTPEWTNISPMEEEKKRNMNILCLNNGLREVQFFYRCSFYCLIKVNSL